VHAANVTAAEESRNTQDTYRISARKRSCLTLTNAEDAKQNAATQFKNCVLQEKLSSRTKAV